MGRQLEKGQQREIDIPSAPMTNTVGFAEPLAVVVVDEVAVLSAGVDIAGLSSRTHDWWGSEGLISLCVCVSVCVCVRVESRDETRRTKSVEVKKELNPLFRSR